MTRTRSVHSMQMDKLKELIKLLQITLFFRCGPDKEATGKMGNNDIRADEYFYHYYFTVLYLLSLQHHRDFHVEIEISTWYGTDAVLLRMANRYK